MPYIIIKQHRGPWFKVFVSERLNVMKAKTNVSQLPIMLQYEADFISDEKGHVHKNRWDSPKKCARFEKYFIEMLPCVEIAVATARAWAVTNEKQSLTSVVSFDNTFSFSSRII